MIVRGGGGLKANKLDAVKRCLRTSNHLGDWDWALVLSSIARTSASVTAKVFFKFSTFFSSSGFDKCG